MKQYIRLNESQLKNLIRECVCSILNESMVNKDMVFISYGTDRFDVNQFRQPIFNSKRAMINNKPVGGLWASPINAEYGWVDFCDSNSFHLKTLAKHFIFKLKTDAKIYVIDNEEDLRKISTLPDMNYYDVLGINWELLREYDGVLVTDNGCRLKFLNGIKGLEAWDVASICIFNPNIIVPIDENAFDKAKVSKREQYAKYPGYDDVEARKYLQMQSDFDKYSNQNVNRDMGDLFNGEHPAILAQKHGNNKNAKLARKFNGTIKSGM